MAVIIFSGTYLKLEATMICHSTFFYVPRSAQFHHILLQATTSMSTTPLASQALGVLESWRRVPPAAGQIDNHGTKPTEIGREEKNADAVAEKVV